MASWILKMDCSVDSLLRFNKMYSMPKKKEKKTSIKKCIGFLDPENGLLCGLAAEVE